MEIQIQTYLVILDSKPDSVLIPSLEGVKVVPIVGKHYGVHLILRDLLQGVQEARDVEVRQKLVTNCFRRNQISNVANLKSEDQKITCFFITAPLILEEQMLSFHCHG